ncbi:uncharacterized protein A4U43_C04F25970 [Asparagus officinalis]|uniref:Uncharacterized protein n=1 Tax=Asparagus officinalis TaxID=4686 RepID=A0A5P1F3Q4_ASPOF|nr:uncharacterized protein A4U43_C04F25970 [Asparagus officinalis]
MGSKKKVAAEMSVGQSGHSIGTFNIHPEVIEYRLNKLDGQREADRLEEPVSLLLESEKRRMPSQDEKVKAEKL